MDQPARTNWREVSLVVFLVLVTMAILATFRTEPGGCIYIADVLKLAGC
jgi:PDZ domain-containing secreted protein